MWLSFQLPFYQILGQIFIFFFHRTHVTLTFTAEEKKRLAEKGFILKENETVTATITDSWGNTIILPAIYKPGSSVPMDEPEFYKILIESGDFSIDSFTVDGEEPFS